MDAGTGATIEAVAVARRAAESSNFLYLTDAGVPLEIVYRLWMVRLSGKVWLVDTGPPLADGQRRGLTFQEDVSTALRRHGIEPDAVERLVLTHLHWDHAGAAALFPNARFYLQRAEAEFVDSTVRRHPHIGRFYDDESLRPVLEGGRLEIVEGDAELTGGLRTMLLAGHTPGTQGVLVSTPDGSALIAGDAAPVMRNLAEDIPPGILVDLPAAIRSLDRIRRSGAQQVFFGHDPQESAALATV
jgi:glyoxylase-like metal-dependent hydrolase (beta-lactamase superfamily II)